MRVTKITIFFLWVIASFHPVSASENLLIEAVKNDQIDDVNRLISSGVKVDEKEISSDKTALYIACSKGNEEMVKALIKAGANSNVECDGKTPFYEACLKGNMNIAKMLGKNADLEEGLFAAATKGHVELVKYFLSLGIDIEECDIFGNTALCIAASNGHIKLVAYLIDQNADIEAIDNSGKTPLAMAVANAHPKVVSYLLEKGSDIECSDNIGMTPLMLAVEKGAHNIVKFLLKAKADIEARDAYSMSALMHAALRGRASITKELLKNGANLHAKTTRCITYESRSSDESSPYYLHPKKTEFPEGATAITFAQICNYPGIEKILLSSN